MTDRDFADMVNPIGRMEREAEERGYRSGLLTGIFYTICGILGLGMLLVALNAHASTWTVEESRRVVKASERGAQISVCQSNSVRMGYRCFFVH